MEFALLAALVFAVAIWVFRKQFTNDPDLPQIASSGGIPNSAPTPTSPPLDGPPYVETDEDRERRRQLNAERNRGFLWDGSDDERFEKIFKENFGSMIDYWFYSKVAGAKRRNPDGTSRAKIIADCEIFEMLELIPEPDNEFDPNAQMIVRSPNGEQLGYVQARAAMEITRGSHNGRKWFAVLKNHNYHPESGKIIGANIILARLSQEPAEKAGDSQSE